MMGLDGAIARLLGIVFGIGSAIACPLALLDSGYSFGLAVICLLLSVIAERLGYISSVVSAMHKEQRLKDSHQAALDA